MFFDIFIYQHSNILQNHVLYIERIKIRNSYNYKDFVHLKAH